MTERSEGAAGPGRRPSWLSRNLLVLCGVSFLQDAASELLYPILPIFLTVTLGAPVALVGIVEGVAEGAASLTKLTIGRISDRWRRRPLIGIGYGLAAVGKVLISVATVWPLVLAGRVVDRFGKGIRGAPRDALLVVGVPDDARGRAFGLHRAADTSGAVVGPLIGLGAYELLHHHIRPLLIVAVVPAVLSVALVRWVHEDPRPVRVAAPAPTERPAAQALPPRFRRVALFLVVFSLVNFPDSLLLLRVAQVSDSLPFVVLAYAAYNVAYAGLSYPLGALADRIGPPKVFAFGLVCFAVGYLGLGLTHSRAAVWPLLLIYGGFTAATDGVGKTWVSEIVPRDAQGRAQGIYQGLTGGAVLLAGLWAGLAWNGSGRIPLVLSGSVGLALAVALLLPAVRRTLWAPLPQEWAALPH